MLQLCNIARNILREVVFCNLSHSGTRKMCLSRIYHSNRFRFPGLFVLVTCFLVFSVWLYTTTSYKSIWDTVPYFGINGLSMILFLWSPPPPLIKVASNTRPCSKLGGQYYTVSHRSVNSSDLKQERSFFPRTLSIFCIWLKFLVEKSIIKSCRHGRRTRIPNEKTCQSTMWVLYLLSSWDPLGDQSQLQGSYLTGVLYSARINNVDSLLCVDK